MYWGNGYSQAAPVAQKPAEGTVNILHVYVHSFVSLPFLFIAVTAVTQQLHWVFGLPSTFLTGYLLSVCIVWIFSMYYKEETVC